MPSKCTHFAHLSARFSELSAKFVDGQVAAELANPSTYLADLDELAAFRLLFHAEVETFLEAKAAEGLSSLESSVNAGGAWRRAFPHVLCLLLAVQAQLPVRELAAEADITALVKSAIASGRAMIKKNNGIKAQAFAFLSIAAGKTLDEVDSTLSSTLNSYGVNRGEVAHGSAVRSRSIASPSSEKSAARTIVDSLALYFDVMA